MGTDIEHEDPAYRLGRLFALLEKAKKNATGALSRIRDPLVEAVSATPAEVFPEVVRLGQHLVGEAGGGGYTDKLVAEIADGGVELPKHLSLEGQDLFSLGYFHERSALFRDAGKE